MGNREHLFFTGIKHSGKTTFAKLIATEWNYSFVDSDNLIEEKIKPLTIREFYKREGKDAFMNLELECVKTYINTHNDKLILSLGGGASDNTQLMKILKENGIVIYLQRAEDAILPVILEHGIPPFLDKDNPKESFHDLYKKRDEIYHNFADMIIELGSYGDKEEKKIQIIRKLKENGYGI